jgi:hypothetical protein
MLATFPIPKLVDIANRVTPVAWKLWCSCKRAQSLSLDPWAFALPAEVLNAAGLTDKDLSWLTVNNHVKVRHANRRNRKWRRRPNESRLVVLTESGAGMIEQFCLHAVKPQWDPERRELTVEGDVIKVFRQPSETQEIVLAAFQEDGWINQIDDPLPRTNGSGDDVAKARLRKTVEHLNRAQRLPILFFSVAGNTQNARWFFRHAAAHSRTATTTASAVRGEWPTDGMREPGQSGYTEGAERG